MSEIRTGKRHPGLPRGRQADPGAVAELRALLGDRALTGDLLIEHLHLIQDEFGHLAARHLTALAELMRLPLVAIYEVATFYAHFEVAEDDAPPPPAVVRVCDGPACRMAGADRLTAPEGMRLKRVPCLGRCDHAPAATVVAPGGRFALIDHATPEALAAAPPTRPAPEPRLAAYRAGGGYRLLAECLSGATTPEEMIATIEAAGLRGLGGAGFPTHRKWRTVRAQPAPRLLAVNADEGEPGTFKDRHILLSDPHRMLEGMLVAAWAIDAAAIYIYLRDEYPDIRLMLEAELAALAEAGLATLPIHLRRGAGAYVCGEESAMLESIEGRRGLPRHRPPLVAERGLFGRPTLVNNVETLAAIRDIAETGRAPHRLYSVSGRVRLPGVKSAAAGITLNRLIEDHCGGMAEGHRLRAFLPGGASGGIFPASLADVPLEFGAFEPHGGFIGSAAVIVLSDKDDLRQLARDLTAFFAHESCGQCTPCRVGTHKAVELLKRGEWDHGLLDDLARVMQDASICGLGQAAPNVWQTLLRHFPEETP
jgi:formate dehydrogenase beta subunit